MTNVSPATEQAADLLQNLSLESQTNILEAPEANKNANSKKPSPIKLDGGEVPSAPVSSNQRSTTPTIPDFMDPTMCYLPSGYPSSTYFYGGGYDGSMNEWEEYPRYMNSDGVEMPQLGVYGDSGPIMYHNGYGYAPYGAYSPAGSPVPTMGHDGQFYRPQHYQYAAPYYQLPTPSAAVASATQTSNQVAVMRREVSTSAAADQVPVAMDNGNGNAKGDEETNAEGSVPLGPNYMNSMQTPNGLYGRGVLQGSAIASGYQNPRFHYDGYRSPTPTTTASTPLQRNQNLHPLPNLVGLHPGPPSGMGPGPGFVNRVCYNNRVYGQFANMVRAGLGSGGFDSRANGRGWLAADKYRSRGRGNGLYYGNDNADGLNELNRGPRAGRLKNQKGIAPNVMTAAKEQNLPINSNGDVSEAIPDRDQYNRAEFPIKYSDAKFFVIKSYSEDDIHRSIKYGVWASTPNGNKKLDAAYQGAKEKSDGCPIFLFFSVNTSGQFVGVAEMVGPVDFNKNLEYWQQDKWNGCFPVKWHIVKDVPNNLLKHIILDNNDNKPVTNSRDTQEAKFKQGLDMLEIFKGHTSKTSILDDYGFYESRQKAMQERKAKISSVQKQVSNGNPTDALPNDKDSDVSDLKAKLQKPLLVVSFPAKEASETENNSIAGTAECPQD